MNKGIKNIRKGYLIGIACVTLLVCPYIATGQDTSTFSVYDISEQPDRITLTWYGLNKGNSMQVASVNVFRRIHSRGEYKALPQTGGFRNGDGDTVLFTIIDHTVELNSMYQYALEPVDAGGRRGKLTGHTEANTLEGGLNARFAYFEARSLESGNQIRLAWRTEHVPLARAIQVYRSTHYDSGYYKIADLPLTDTTFIDYVEIPMESYFYYLTLVTPTGTTSPGPRISGVYSGTDKPLPPSAIEASADINGIAITILSDESNIAGFYIYRGLSIKGDLQQVTDLIPFKTGQATYIDSSQSLDPRRMYTYAVRSISKTYTLSEFSDRVTARPGRPTTIKTPGDLSVIATTQSIRLNWEDLSLTEEALGGYLIYRKEADKRQFDLLHAQSPVSRINYYTDTTLVPGTRYTYAYEAFDVFGARSGLGHSLTIDFEGYTPVAPSGLEAMVLDGEALLTWGKTAYPGLKGYKLYRYSEGTKPVIISTNSPTELSYAEKGLKPGVVYFYFVTSFDAHGRESGPGEIIPVGF